MSNNADSRPLCQCGLVPRLMRSEGRVYQVCPHLVRGYNSRYRATHRPCSFYQDQSGDLEGTPNYCAELLKPVEWPAHYDVASPPGDPWARYRPKSARQQQTASGSGGGEGSRPIPDTGLVPRQQFVLAEERAEAAGHECERLRRRVADLEHELKELKLSDSAEVEGLRQQLRASEANLREQTKEMVVLKRKYDDVVGDNVIFREHNRVLRMKLEEGEKELEDKEKELRRVRSAGRVLSQARNASAIRPPRGPFGGPSEATTSSSQTR
ncbi:hypothetical protein FS749_016760 [Ceratobasidium sp. UAMH 11750]|nr:hypothetical protein FS749_016760 [Ceratobasidium sp. UAMH 11750]